MPRHVRPADHARIREVVAAAFGRADEADLVERLRANGDVVFELVEETEGRIVGHVLLSRLYASSHALYAALAPLSVDPAVQRQGVGGKLVTQAVQVAEDFGVAGILILGDPAYYGRFGFETEAARLVKSPYSGPHLTGRAIEAGAFSEPLTVAYPTAFGGA